MVGRNSLAKQQHDTNHGPYAHVTAQARKREDHHDRHAHEWRGRTHHAIALGCGPFMGSDASIIPGLERRRSSRCCGASSLMAIFDKLFFLAVRQLSKPVANAIKQTAISSNAFQAVLAAAGQRMHRIQIQVTRAAAGKVQLGNISPLSNDRAVASGAELLGEAVIYSIAGLTVTYEWNKSKRSEAEKERKEEAAEMRRREESRVNEQRQWDEVRNSGDRSIRATPMR